jgi:hypothetical protein
MGKLIIIKEQLVAAVVAELSALRRSGVIRRRLRNSRIRIA